MANKKLVLKNNENEIIDIENMYIEGENEPIGILLCADKDDAVVEMTLGEEVKNVYASKYLTYLPSKEELIKIIKDEKELYELAQKNEKE